MLPPGPQGAPGVAGEATARAGRRWYTQGMEAQLYPIPSGPHRVEAEIQRSRFITTVAPAPTVDVAKAFIARVREEHPDANHNCWAYVVGPPRSQGQGGRADGGPPARMAGPAVRQAVAPGGGGGVAVVVLRFFGGTALGKGGLEPD